MTQCLTDEELLSYLFEDQGSAESDDQQLHVAACHACQDRLADFRRTEQFVSEAYHATAVRSEWLGKMQSLVADEPTDNGFVTKVANPAPGYAGRLWIAAAACLVTAAMILVMVSASRKPIDREPSPQPVDVITQNTLDDSGRADNESPVPDSKLDIVKPQGDFLVARDPQSDDSFELYWVLPVQN
jgi:hypothetical protein